MLSKYNVENNKTLFKSRKLQIFNVIIYNSSEELIGVWDDKPGTVKPFPRPIPVGKGRIRTPIIIKGKVEMGGMILRQQSLSLNSFMKF